MINRFESNYGLNTTPITIKTKRHKPVITLEGFTDPIKTLELTAGLAHLVTFINPHAEIVTMESQQIEDAIAGYKDKTVFMFTPTKPGIFALGKAVIDGINKPHQSIFIVDEKDMDFLKTEGDKADDVISIIKNQGMGLFSNVAEARNHIEKNLDGTVTNMIDGKPVDIEDPDTIVGAS